MANAIPNQQDYVNKLSNFHGKLLDGSAFIDAYTTWILPFLFACSTLVQDAWSVYDTWCGSDPTGPNYVAVAGAVITAPALLVYAQQRANRNNRLHVTLMQFIVPNSFLFDDLNTLFPRDGIGAVTYLRSVIEETRIVLQTTRMESEWTQMNITNCRIEIGENTMSKWMTHLQNEARTFTPMKTTQQIFDKFMTGNHEKMQSYVIQEQLQPNPAYITPAVQAEPMPHPGQAHPQAGQKNLLAVRNAFSMIWTTLYVSGQIQSPDFVNQVAEDNIGSEDINWVQQRGRGRGRGRVRQTDGKGAKGGKGKGGLARTIKKPDAFYLKMYKDKKLERAVNEFVTCYKCGGVGHTGVTRFTDGTLVVCATLATFPDGLPTGVLENIVHGHMKDQQNARAALLVDDDDVEAQYANMELGMNVEMDDPSSSSDMFHNICNA